MVDEIRHRHEMKVLELQGKPSITNYSYNPTDFIFPTYLQVPLELSIAQTTLHQSAYHTIRGMKEIMYFHDHRFSFLCPQSPKSDWTIHCKSMARLCEWQEDTNPPQSTSTNSSLRTGGDFTLASALKLPKEVIRIRLDARYYGLFVSSYVSYLDEFFHGAWSEYMRMKHEVEGLAARCLSDFVYREWIYWWNMEFKRDMRKWEDCCAVLPLPMWEEVIDELYLMIVDRVDEPDEIAGSLCRIGGRSGPGRFARIGAGPGFCGLMSRGLDGVHEGVEISIYLAPNNADHTRGVEEGEDIMVRLDLHSLMPVLRCLN